MVYFACFYLVLLIYFCETFFSLVAELEDALIVRAFIIRLPRTRQLSYCMFSIVFLPRIYNNGFQAY